jgi:hypothetical protein
MNPLLAPAMLAEQTTTDYVNAQLFGQKASYYGGVARTIVMDLAEIYFGGPVGWVSGALSLASVGAELAGDKNLSNNLGWAAFGVGVAASLYMAYSAYRSYNSTATPAQSYDSSEGASNSAQTPAPTTVDLSKPAPQSDPGAHVDLWNNGKPFVQGKDALTEFLNKGGKDLGAYFMDHGGADIVNNVENTIGFHPENLSTWQKAGLGGLGAGGFYGLGGKVSTSMLPSSMTSFDLFGGKLYINGYIQSPGGFNFAPKDWGIGAEWSHQW